MKSICERIKLLRNVRSTIKHHENEICEALHADLRKSYFEAQISELQPVYDELTLFEKQLHTWAHPQRVATSIKLFPARSYIQPEPYGNVVIFAPWNFPFSLSIRPLIGALGAGNNVTIKPSEHAPHTAAIIKKIIESTFNSEHVRVVIGDATVAESLLTNKWDYIFFTGSTRVGKIVMKHAAEHITPVTLELGGMNPCIVDATANIDTAARRIIWGKMLNAGQNCLAPNTVYVHTSIKDAFITACKNAIIDMYGTDPQQSSEYARIVNDKHIKRLTALLENTPVIFGGTIDESDRYIAPTLVTDLTDNHPLLHEEIFGPILPIQPYTDIDTLIAYLKQHPRPLALYIFSSNCTTQRHIMNNIISGGVAINDVILHAANPHLPFGGIGLSGLGSYHGKASFDTFTHYRSVLINRWWPEITLRYAPWRWGHAMIKKWL